MIFGIEKMAGKKKQTKQRTYKNRQQDCRHPKAHLVQSESGKESWYLCPECGSEW